MKKLLIALLGSFILASTCFADCSNNSAPQKEKSACETNNSCNKCDLDEDDEYCIYNQCFFDKEFILLKRSICPTRQQEAQIDVIYKNFKADMEQLHAKFRSERYKLLEMIACNDCNWKDQKKIVKETGKEMKNRAKCFKEDIKEQLCRNQYSDFRKYNRNAKRKMKKLIKYGKTVKFPCTNCECK